MRTLLVISLLALAVGCKDKPTTKAPPKNAGSAAGSGSGAPAPDLELPHSDGSAPKKTTAPLGKADFERLSKLEFPGFIADVRGVGDKYFEVRQKTKDHPRLWAVVTIEPCDGNCTPMELDKWKAKESVLKTANLESLAEAKDLEWEMGEATLNGAKVITIYQLATGNAPGEGGGQYSFSNAFLAYYNDGMNQIRVVGTYKDDPASKDDLKKLAPKDDLRALALAFLDAYTHQW